MSILSLLYRTVGPWGAGKGSDLDADEIDQNFYDLEQAVEALAANPAQPAEIEDVTVTNGDQLTFTLSDATVLGPVTLPSSKPTWRGDWLASTAYVHGDLFEAVDPADQVTKLYYVNRNFTSGLAFDPDLGIGIGGTLPYASFVMVVQNRVRVGWYWPGKPGEGIDTGFLTSDDSPLMFSFLTTDAFYIDGAFTGSIAKLRSVPDAAMRFAVSKNNVTIGFLDFPETDADGVFSPFLASSSDEPAEAYQFNVGDSLELSTPFDGVDLTAYGLAVTIVGKLGQFDFGSSS